MAKKKKTEYFLICVFILNKKLLKYSFGRRCREVVRQSKAKRVQRGHFSTARTARVTVGYGSARANSTELSN